MKKIVTLLLVLVLTLSLTCAVSAAETGSITINGVADGTVYEIYQLLDLESYNKESGAYSYKINSAWTAYFETAEAQSYITVDAAGYVTWVAGEDDTTVAEFAQKALAYAKANGSYNSRLAALRRIYKGKPGYEKQILIPNSRRSLWLIPSAIISSRTRILSGSLLQKTGIYSRRSSTKSSILLKWPRPAAEKPASWKSSSIPSRKSTGKQKPPPNNRTVM